MVDFLWVLVGFMVYLSDTVSVYVQATHTSLLQDLLIPVDKRYMSTQKRLFVNDFPEDVIEAQLPLECCPSVTRAIAPLGGLARDGSLLQLFRDSNTIQKFYETTCARGVKGHPCNFINQAEWVSRCEQTHTYTYAIVKDFNVTESYRIDYMKINSGCSCSVKGTVIAPVVSFSDELLHELASGLIVKK